MNKISHDSEILKEVQQVITACAFIYHNFDGVVKVFLPKRADTKKFLPGVYELPGGHIDFGEELEVGLKREIMEELGMEANIHEPFAAFTYVNEIKKSHSVEIIYFAEFINPISEIKINTEDHSEFVWVSKEEIEGIFSHNQAIHPKGEDDPEVKAIRKGFKKLK